jgi:FkbM family methyltransferase
MRNIFIDCGANLGQGYERLNQKHNLTDYDIIMFDIIPAACSFLKEKYPSFTIINKGVWWCDEIRNIQIEGANIDNVSNVGHESNILEDKHKRSSSGLHHQWDTIKLECIDFAKFLQTFDSDSNIFLKLDVEGAEYDIVDHLINTKTLQLIKKLNIEWHPQFRNDEVKDINYYSNIFIQNNVLLVDQ